MFYSSLINLINVLTGSLAIVHRRLKKMAVYDILR